MKPVGVLHNTATNRYHPIVFRYAPPPSGDLPTAARYKSIGHHTAGFDTLDQAIAEIEKQEGWWNLNTVWAWDGEGVPAKVIWGPVPSAMENPNGSST